MHGFVVHISRGGYTQAPLIMQIVSEYVNYEASVVSISNGEMDPESIVALTVTLAVMIVDRSSLGGRA